MELVKLLDDLLHDYSDVRVSAMTGIERTRVNRIRNGKFKPTYKEIESIIKAFMVSDDKAKQLYETYFLEKWGRDKFNSRVLAKEFLTSLKLLEADVNTPMSEGTMFSLNVNFKLPENIMVLNSSIAVNQVATMVITQAATENDTIRIVGSPFDDKLISMIFNLSAGYRDLEIEHIYSVASSNELTEPMTYYMEVAKAVYPIFMMNTNYKAYYSLIGHTTNSLLPYYIVTSRYAVVVSSDVSSGIIISNSQVIELVKKLFAQRMETCTPFIKKITTPGEFLQHYVRVMEIAAGVDSKTYYSIDYEPCMLHFFRPEDIGMMKKNIEDAPLVYALLQKIESQLLPTFNDQKQVAFFTKNGVDSFIRTGQIAEIPDGLGLKFTYERRKELLQLVLNAMKNEKKSQYVYRLLNEKVFDPPLGLRFLGTGAKTDHLFIMSNSKDGVRSILSLSNPDVVSSVFDFIEALEESNMVYSPEKMIDYMEKKIAEM